MRGLEGLLNFDLHNEEFGGLGNSYSLPGELDAAVADQAGERVKVLKSGILAMLQPYPAC